MRCQSVLDEHTKGKMDKLNKDNNSSSCSIRRKLIGTTSADDGRDVAESLPDKDSSMVISSREIRRNRREETEANICQLPPEVLLKIFAGMCPVELSRSVAPVCRAWHDIAHDHTLWRQVSFRGMGVATSQLTDLIRSKPRLSTIILADRYDLNEILAKMVESNSTVENLSIHRCSGSHNRKNVHSKVMVKLIRRCKELKSIVIEDTRFRSCQFYRTLLPKISKDIKYLRMIVRPSLKEWKILAKGQHLYKLKIRAH